MRVRVGVRVRVRVGVRVGVRVRVRLAQWHLVERERGSSSKRHRIVVANS